MSAELLLDPEDGSVYSDGRNQGFLKYKIHDIFL